MPGTWRAIIAGGEVKGSGERNLRVTIQQATNVQGETGYPIQQWTDLPPLVYMWRIHVQSDERWAANQVSAYRVYLWQMPYRADMDPDLVNISRDRRLVYAGRVYDIRSGTRLELSTIEVATLSQDS